MIQEVVAASVSCAEALGDTSDAALHPVEERAMSRALPGRRAEFTTGRHCARRALAGLGFTDVAVPRGPDGEPRWPDGVVGSITHTEGYRAAAVARAQQVRAVGIDAEPNLPLPEGVVDMVASQEERAALATLAASRPDVHWDRLLFSAKESVYKSWFTLTGTPLWFNDAVLELDADHGTFTARVLRETEPHGTLRGRWIHAEGRLATGIVVPAGPGKEGGRT
ncbi:MULTISPECIES: 4'-phosphopantetheinyl transferase [unclassified Streptomyces]|uniref:4'-phosphopantetheinyl transferase family protein n=1 Tax=unclassified Streptomyces TaxID=2593676 RepID=UPI00278C8C9B|nr:MULTISPECIES: 4'-phosphopantetheinyl transferase superfamily protein [unclassified Streptomyces]